MPLQHRVWCLLLHRALITPRRPITLLRVVAQQLHAAQAAEAVVVVTVEAEDADANFLYSIKITRTGI
jgi:hypothetical protein